MTQIIAQRGQHCRAHYEDVTENDERGEAGLASVVKEGQEKLLQAETPLTGRTLLCGHLNKEHSTQHFPTLCGSSELELDVLDAQK